MKTRLLILSLLAAAVLTAHAQVELKMKKRDGLQQQKKTGDGPLSGGGRRDNSGERMGKIKADREVLYADAVKRYGRWEGYGKPISKEYASHLRSYFKFTYVKGAKYPTRLQAYDGYHNLTTNHSIRTYLNKGDSDDQSADSLWTEKLNSVVQWDFVYNEKDEISIERAYDADGKLVFSYYPVKIGNRVAGTFTDAWGMPARLRKQGGAQVVYITYDKNGFECLQEYYDEKGFRQPNQDGAYMSKTIYRPDGLGISSTSCNIVGQPMIDRFGNSGMEAVYDEKGRMVYDTNMDTDWKPFRLQKGDNPYYYNMIRRHYEYDDYGRLTKKAFVDLNNRPDTNSVGIHAEVLTYNDHGQITSYQYIGLDGKPRINSHNGLMGWEQRYDNQGNIIYHRSYGDSAKLQETNYKEMIWLYDREGTTISQKNTNFNGDIYTMQRYARTADGLQALTANDVCPKDYVEIRHYGADNMVIREERDGKGNQTLWEYTDFDGKPIAPYGYWRDINKRQYFGDTLHVVTEVYLDTLGKPMKYKDNAWVFRKDVTHFSNGKMTYSDACLYNADSTYHNGWRSYFNEEGTKTGEASLNAYGKPSRRGHIIYHYVGIDYSLKSGDAASYVGYDEFGEPAYIETNKSVSHFWNFANDELVYYDEHGNKIDDMEAFRDSLPVVMSFAVNDTVAYQNGIQDGDIILRYGDWITDMHLQGRRQYNLFYFKLIEWADREKKVLLLRPVPTEKRYEVVELTLPKGNIQQLGVFPQLIYYTNKEREHHEAAVSQYLSAHGLQSLGKPTTQKGTHRIYIRKPNRIKGYIPGYVEKAQPYYYNPAVVLSMARFVKHDGKITANKYWNFDMQNDTLQNILKNKDELPSYYISVTTDLNDYYDGYPYYSNCHELGTVMINDEQFARVQKSFADFMERNRDYFDPNFRKKLADDTTDKSALKKCSPTAFFKQLKKERDVIYTPHALTIINSDSLRLPQCFNDMEMVSVPKAQNHALYQRIKEEVDQIDTTGYTRLPNFYSEDLVLVKKTGKSLFNEVLIVYFSKAGVKVGYQKGLFSMDEMMAVQKNYGRSKATRLFEKEDATSAIPLIRAHTEGDGHARVAGLEGHYVVLEYNEWDMSKGLDGFLETLQKAKAMDKYVVLMRIHFKDDNTFDYFDPPKAYRFKEGMLGMRMLDWDAELSLYERAASAYEKFKTTEK